MSKIFAAIIVLSMIFSSSGTSKGCIMFPEGIRLNNPGLIKLSQNDWEGMSKHQKNSRFVRFSSPKYGIRAMMRVIITYNDKYELNTVSRIITRWAPPGENNTDFYIKDVSNRSGFPPNVILNVEDPRVLMRLAQAITLHENGAPPEDMPVNWYEEMTYHEAAMLALGI